MVKADALAIQWRIFAIVAAAAWMLVFLTQLVQTNLAVAIIGAILPSAVIAFTIYSPSDLISVTKGLSVAPA